MRRLARPKPLALILMVAVLLALGVAAQYYRLYERAWFNLQSWLHPLSEQSMALNDYQVVLEAKVIDGLDDDVSALTFDPVRNSLFTVTNKNSELIEMSLDGRILRRIALIGFGDPEAVEFISADTYVISDERQQRLIKIHLEEGTTFLDAADAEQEIDLALGVVVHQLVAGDAVLVEAAGFVAGLEHHHVMAVHGQAVGAGQPCRAGADHGDTLAGGCRALERVCAELGVVQGVTLQLADQHRRAFLGVVAHAGLLAKDFRRADPGTTAAENVCRKNFLRCAGHVVLMDVADERRNVDLARARIDARRVVAIQAARGFQMRLPGIERRRQIGEMPGEGGRAFVRVGEMVQGLDHGFVPHGY